MDTLWIENKPVNPVNAEEWATPTPRINLSTGEDVRREMGRIYREARAGTLGMNEASKFFYMLGHILKAHEVVVLENRLIPQIHH